MSDRPAAGHASPLLPIFEEAGGVTAEYHGTPLVRHFGDPRREYAAATEALAVFDRSHRSRLSISGRSPGQMLNGMLTGVLPTAPGEVEPGVIGGGATYHAVLTPKGRMITDLTALLPGDAETVGYLLDVPVAGRAGLLAHFGKFLPPRFAKVMDRSLDTASISVVGPEAAGALSRLALGLSLAPDALASAPEGTWWARTPVLEHPIVVRTDDVWPPAWTVYGAVEGVGALWRALVRHGAVPAGLAVWKTLGVEAGRPTFGADMDEATLPPEAGIVERAIDQTKGCYTGQEVIVRIRDRGHVNRYLRRLLLGDVPAPAPGTELVATDGSDKAVGHVTSAVQSPRFGGVAALAYVRRGVDRVRLGSDDFDVPPDFPSVDDAP